MSGHNIFAPSASPRWIECVGSMSCKENYADYDAGEDAALGSGAHAFADRILRSDGRDADFFLGEQVQIGDPEKGETPRVFTLDAEMAMYIQVYVDYCRNLAGSSGVYFPEQRVTINLGTPAFTTEPQITEGTSDCQVPLDRVLHTIDLKYGKGVKVYARENFQEMLYTQGALDTLREFGPYNKFVAHIVQPRLDHIDSWEFTREELEALCRRAAEAMKRGKEIIYDPSSVKPEDFNPGEKQCRWCRFVECPARAAFVQAAVGMEFEQLSLDTNAQPAPETLNNDSLATKYQAIPLIKSWINAIMVETQRRVLAGAKVLGRDGLPMKPVQGQMGNREWAEGSEAEAEAALLGQFGAAAYKPQTIVTPTAAEDLLKAKIKGRGAPAAREALWAQTFAPHIHRAPGKVIIVLGSDEREEYRGSATIEEFSNGD